MCFRAVPRVWRRISRSDQRTEEEGSSSSETNVGKNNSPEASVKVPGVSPVKTSKVMADLDFTSQTREPSEFTRLRERLGSEFRAAAELVSSSRRPLPDLTGNGTYLNEDSDAPETSSKLEEALNDLRHLGIPDIRALVEVQAKTKTGALWDDKNYLMEKVIRTAVACPEHSHTQKKVTNAFITTLYDDLQHPPISMLGKEYQYRSADGSYNNPKHPDLGKAGTPYARTVAPKTMQPGALPHPEVIFDSIMARKPENVEKHPNQISSVLFYLASIIIHDVFRTNHRDLSISDTSSYLDLAPLYGSSLEEQMRVRTGLGGKLKPDTFAEPRLLSLPPGCGVLLIMFNRFHNSVAEQLANINEGGRFTRPEGNVPHIDRAQKEWWKDAPKDWAQYDEDLFQVARLVTSGLYINIILFDYVRTILNLNKENSEWTLDPRVEINGVELAAGNQCSAEFNLVYRWHSAISERDEKWTEKFVDAAFGGKDFKTMDTQQVLKELSTMGRAIGAVDPGLRTFGDMQRRTDGTFDDDDLVKWMTESIEDCSNSFGANRVPTILRAVEVLGIEQARAWNVASLNEFRKYFTLKPHEKFTDINSDEYVASQLQRLYDHPDQVELYPGLVAEEAKLPLIPGSGLCPSYTVSRAVLSDAVALVRGDRFYTVDYHPKKLTNWGFQAASYDKGIDHGAVFYKLFLTAFPHHFRPTSVYAHYPMTTPDEMGQVLRNLGRDHHYSFERPARLPKTSVFVRHDAVRCIATNCEVFRPTWGGAMKFLNIGPTKTDCEFPGSMPNVSTAQSFLASSLASSNKWTEMVRQYFEDKTLAMLRQKAYKVADINQVDIIRDIGNLIPMHFVGELFSFPIKTKQNVDAVFTEHELYLALLAVYSSFLKDNDSITSFGIRQVSQKAVHCLAELVKAHVQQIHEPTLTSRFTRRIFGASETPISNLGDIAIKSLLETETEMTDIPAHYILPTASTFAITLGSTFSTTLEYLTSPARDASFKASLHSLATSNEPTAFQQLQYYVLEAARLSCQSAVYRHVSISTSLPDGPDHTRSVSSGERVLLNLRAALTDAKKFPDPANFDPTRPLEAYDLLALGPTDGLGFEAFAAALTAMMRVVLGLKGLAPAKGPQGRIKTVPRMLGHGDEEHHDLVAFLSENWDAVWPVAQSMKVTWE